MCPGVQGLYYLSPFKDSEVFDRQIEGLIKAGFKGEPTNYYKLKKENKLLGQEIQDLIFGKTIRGNIFNFTWSMTTNKDGKTEYANPILGNRTFKGKSWVKGDTVCRQYESLYDGIKDCAEIYRNPEGDNMTYSEYLLLTDYLIIPFSIEE
ncbi:MAG: hypothetical protein GY707_18555 [Desulfobacteraceae bacterium]|nr:hypothetical protein [Desulfobacteraceae bacterium]